MSYLTSLFNPKEKTRNKYIPYSKKIITIYENDIEAINNFENQKPLNESQESWDSKQKTPIKFVNFTTDTLCRLYNEPVKRTLNEKYAKNTKLNDLLERVIGAYIEIANDLDSYTFVGGMTAVKPFYHDGDFNFIVYTAPMIDRTPNAINPFISDNISLIFKNDDVEKEEIWDKKKEYFYVDGSHKEDQPNPYGFIPITIFRNKNLLHNWFTPPPMILLTIQDTLSMMFTHGNRLSHWQTHAQWAMYGDFQGDKINIAPNAVVHIPNPSGKLEAIAPSADIKSLIEWINTVMKFSSNIEGIPDSLYVSSGANKSGVAIMASNEVLKDFLRKRSKIFLKSEQEILLKAMKVIAHHEGINIPDDLRVVVSHTMPKSPMNAQELNQWQFELLNNIRTEADYLISKNPNMNKKDAEKIIKENKEFRDSLAKQEIDLSKLEK